MQNRRSRTKFHGRGSGGGFAAGALALSAGALLLAPSHAPAIDKPTTSHPRLANYFLAGSIPDVESLARWDMVILSTTVSRAQIDSLRLLNPDIRILAYVVSNGTVSYGGTLGDDPKLRVEYEYWQACQAGDWWLYRTDGEHASDWPDKWDTNPTVDCPVDGQGRRFRDWLPEFVVDRVLDYDPGKYDGVFLDDVWENISWLNATMPAPIDLDRDGVAEGSSELNGKWSAGMSAIVDAVRALVGDRYIVMGNGPNRFYPANGTMIENFPYNGPVDPDCPLGYAWSHWMLNSVYAYFPNIAGFSTNPAPSNLVHCGWDYGTLAAPQRDANYERFKRFTLGSALLGDGWYSLDFNGDIHASMWWEPEYDLPLGVPLGPARRETTDKTVLYPTAVIWVRDFTNGKVVVNPTANWLWQYPGVDFLLDWDAAIVSNPPLPVSAAWLTSYSASGATYSWDNPYGAGDCPLSGFEIRIADEPIVDEAGWAAAAPDPSPPDFPVTQPAFTHTTTGLDLGEMHYLAIRSRDAADRLSPISSNLVLSPVVGVHTDEAPPSAPSGLEFDLRDGTVRLSWRPSAEPGVVGYRVLGATETGAFAPRPGGPVPANRFEEPAGADGVTRYQVIALASDGRQSAPSAIVRIGILPARLSAFPNPFADALTVRASSNLEEASSATRTEGSESGGGPTLRVFDVLGREIRSLRAVDPAAPVPEWVWDGRSTRGVRVPAGAYWLRVDPPDGDRRHPEAVRVLHLPR